ncbi:MAG TPA: alcohol dehydrogenase catalytic domain-containing protein [Polyangia bacterium]|nr:alcohol dehydrogenase catalytic domain-containing protein [Polyangia bacterium]
MSATPDLQAGYVVITVAGAALGVEPRAEIAGTVSAVGDAAGEWLGKRVVVPRILPCGDCNACRRGRVAHCRSRAARNGLATTETVPARWLCSVEPPLWPESAELWQLAALADAALAPYTALSRAGVGPSDRVVVVGRDARAHFAAAIAVAKGAAVIAADAIEAGAVDGDGAVIIATSAADRHRALTLAGHGATVVMLDSAGNGNASDAAPFATDWARLVDAEAHVIGSVGGHPDLLPELCALVVRGQLPLAAAVRRVTVDDAAPAHAAYLRDGGPLPIAVP